MPTNPINLSEILKDDGIVLKLIQELKELQTLVASMKKDLVSAAGGVEASVKKANVATDEGRKIIQMSAEEARKLALANKAVVKAQFDIKKSTNDVANAYSIAVETAKKLTQADRMQVAAAVAKTQAGKEAIKQTITSRVEIAETTKVIRAQTMADRMKTEEGKQATLEQMKAMQTMRLTRQELIATAMAANSAEGSYNQLAAMYKKLKLELNAMSAAERSGTEEGKAMEMQAKRIYEEMNRLQQATGKFQLQVGNYASGLRDTNMNLKEMAQALTQLRNMPTEGKTAAEIRDIEMAIGELSDRQKKYQQEVLSYGMDTFQMISGAASGAIAAVQGLAGAFNVLGIENDKLKKVQQNMMSMIAITQALDRIEKLYHQQVYQTLILRTKNMVLGWKEIAVKKANALATWLQVRAQQAQVKATVTSTAATTGATVATTAATVATTAWAWAVRVFSKAVYNIPVFGWLLAVLGAIIGLVVMLVKYWDKVTNVFVKMGKWLGIVKQTRGELKSLQAQIALYNKQLEVEQKLQSNREKNINRQLALMRAQGKAVEDIRKKEWELLNAQIKGTETQVELARVLYQAKLQNRKATDEEKQEALQAYQELMTSLGDLRFQAQIMKAEDEQASAARVEQIRSETAERIKAAQERAKAEADAANAETKAGMELRVLQAKNEKERLEARVALLRFEGELERAAMERNSNHYLLSLKKQNDEEAALRKEALNNWMTSEEAFTEMLMSIRNSEETRALSDLWRVYEGRLELAKEFGEGESELTEWYEAEKLKIKQAYAEKSYQSELEAFEKQQVFAENEFLAVERTEAEKTRYRLEAEKARYEKILELAAKYQSLYSEQEIENFKNLIKQVDLEIDGIGAKDSRDIYDMLGIDVSDKGKQAIASATQQAVALVQWLAQERVDAAKKVVDATQKEVDAARKALDEQKKLAADGHASNEAEARAALDAAEAREKEALKKQEQAQKKQAKLQSLEQAGNMIVASSKVIKDFGMPWALPVLAIMWGTFIAQKRKAKEVATEYGEGHYEVINTGGSHRSGRDTPLGIDRRNRRVEKGEAFAVFRKTAVDRYKGALPEMVKMANNLTLEKATGDYLKLSTFSVQNEFDTKGLERGINTLIDQGQRRTYVDGLGRLVVEQNNVKKTYV